MGSVLPLYRKSVMFKDFGSVQESLFIKEREIPVLKDDEILVKMSMSVINPSDLLAIKGFGILPKYINLPAVAGYEGVGKIVARGANVQMPIGSRVLPLRGEGTWQDYVISQAKEAIIVPDEIDDKKACQMYVNPLTAWVLLTQIVDLSSGRTVVVANAGGSSFVKLVAQFSKFLNFRLIALTRRDDYTETLLKLGAEYVINTSKDDFAEKINEYTQGIGADIALDGISGEPGGQLALCLKPYGELINYGVLSGEAIQLNMQQISKKHLKITPFWLKQWLANIQLSKKLAIFKNLMSFIKDNNICFSELSCYPLDRARDAASEAENNSGRNYKVAIRHGI